MGPAGPLWVWPGVRPSGQADARRRPDRQARPAVSASDLRGAVRRHWPSIVVVVTGIAAVAWASGSVLLTVEVALITCVLLLAVAAIRLQDGTATSSADAIVAPDRSVQARCEAALDRLDPIEHRRLAVPERGLEVVVGPMGVAVVQVLAPATVDGRGRPIDPAGPEVVQAVRVTSAIGGALAGSVAAIAGRVPVRCVLVTGAVSGATPGSVDARPVDTPTGVAQLTVPEALADVLSRGPVLPMRVVDRTYACLQTVVAAERVAISA